MRSVTFESCLNGVASTAGIDPANLLAHEKILLTEYINDAVRFCYDYYPWAEFTLTEKRYFREEYDSTKTYSMGEEVYYDDKYYHCWTSSVGNRPDTSTLFWYEVGDYSNNPEWLESGLYDIGAKVAFDNKNYLCIAVPNSASGIPKANFEYDAIDTTNKTYFKEISNQFDRYIGYEQVGRNPIETIISVHKSDPRYSKATPINFREGVEGIYIESTDAVINEVFIRYRIDSPVYTTSSLTEPVPKFLYPTIKLHAYKSWLVGDGQHEKSELWEIKVYDSLVREVDKLDQQQDRGKPYTIRGNAYRRVNSLQPYVQGQTLDQIGSIKEGLPNISFNFSTNARGRNSARFSSTDSTASIDVTANGRNIVKVAGKSVVGGEPMVGSKVIFPNGYNHPIGTGRFPNNSEFTITSITTNEILWDATFRIVGAGVMDGTIVTQIQAMDLRNPLYVKGTYWDAKNRDDVELDLGLGLTATGANKIVSIGTWRNNGVPLVGRFFVVKNPITLADTTIIPVGRYQIVSQNGGTFQILY